MREPHVRFCERHGGAILRAYSTRPFLSLPDGRPFLPRRMAGPHVLPQAT